MRKNKNEAQRKPKCSVKNPAIVGPAKLPRKKDAVQRPGIKNSSNIFILN
jgi:hypothetical protein